MSESVEGMRKLLNIAKEEIRELQRQLDFAVAKRSASGPVEVEPFDSNRGSDGMPVNVWLCRPMNGVSALRVRYVQADSKASEPAPEPSCVGAIEITGHVSPYTIWSNGELRQYDL